MKDTQNITIGLLCVSAAILVTVLAFSYDADRASGAGVSAAAGEYIMFTGEFSGSIDMLYVVDTTKRRMNTYRLDPMKNTIVRTDTVDLGRAFGGPQE